VPSLSGPPRSAIPSIGGDRIFITDKDGHVVLDVTRARAKLVDPGRGFGEKRAPSREEADLMDAMGVPR
jgi:hypothetical protein